MPHFEIYAKKYPNLSFFKVDIDEIDIKDHAYIDSIPTFYGKLNLKVYKFKFLDLNRFFINNSNERWLCC